jgi:hypothetical protein
MKTKSFRRLAILVGAAWLVWLLLVEDRRPTGALAFAALFCALAGTQVWSRQSLPARQRGMALAALGLAAGLAISPLALLLMAIKTGLHAHPSPDYSGAQVVAVLQLLPALAFGGLLVGLGTGFWDQLRQPGQHSEG